MRDIQQQMTISQTNRAGLIRKVTSCSLILSATQEVAKLVTSLTHTYMHKVHFVDKFI